MKSSERLIWEINIKADASAAATKYGSAAVNSVFTRYESTGLHNLASCYYSEIFAVLEQMANDD